MAMTKASAMCFQVTCLCDVTVLGVDACDICVLSCPLLKSWNVGLAGTPDEYACGGGAEKASDACICTTVSTGGCVRCGAARVPCFVAHGRRVWSSSVVSTL